MAIKFEENKIYQVNHSRKGCFKMQVTSVGETWVTGTIIEGETEALCHYNKKYEGEEVTARISLFISAEEIKPEAA